MKPIIMAMLMVLLVAGRAEGLRVEVTPPVATAQGTLQSVLTVRDEAGVIASGLPADSFTVAIDGMSATVASLRPVTEQWLAVVLLIDKSGSMAGEPLQAAKAAAKDFVGRCGNQTLFAVMPFDEDSLPPLQFLRSDQGVRQLIDDIRVGKNTALYDAILMTLPTLHSHWAPRKAMIALTDGKDTRSKTTFPVLSASIRGSSVPVYTVGLGKQVEAEKLETIASTTGGRYFNAPGPNDLIGIYQAIAAELESGYLLEFKLPSRAGEPGGHQMEVTVRTPAGALSKTVLFELGGQMVTSVARVDSAPVPMAHKREAFRLEPLLIGPLCGLVAGLVGALIVRRRGSTGLRIGLVTLMVVLGALVGGLVSMLRK